MISIDDFSKKQIIFIITSNGDKLSFSNDNVVVKDKDGKVKHQSTCYRLFIICIIGNTTITSGLIQRAKKFNFSICLMTTTFRVYEVLGARVEGNTMLRKRQYSYNDMEIAKKIVANKIQNQSNQLKKIRHRNELQNEAIEMLNHHVSSILECENDTNQLMGIEGSAARIYFSQMFDSRDWHGRKPRVKCDYINTTLDIGYTMIFNLVDALLSIYGFDTYYGVLHKCFYMRKSLACDLMEPVRPLIDYQIRKSIHLKQCSVEDFEEYNKQVILKYKCIPKYIQFLMEAIMENKDAIFVYIRDYYRFFMKQKSVSEMPVLVL